MGVSLNQGGNAVVAPAKILLAVSWAPQQPPGMVLDVSAFCLTEAGRVRGDGDMVFFNQPISPDGAVALTTDGTLAGGQGEICFAVQFPLLATEIHHIAFTVTIDDGQRQGQTLGNLQSLTCRVVDPASREELIRFDLPTAGATEVAMTLAELYQRNGQWKFRAVGQGFAGGLEPLATSYGVEVAGHSAAAPAPSPAPSPAPLPPPVAAPPVAAAPTPIIPAPIIPAPSAPVPVVPAVAAAVVAAAPPVNLSKITLEKKGQSISLEKKPGGDHGRILVNLNWSHKIVKTGFFSRPSAIDLKDGRKEVVQALGDSFGALEREPYVQLMGDDRTGASGAGEDLVINGVKWPLIKRLLIYAFIYKGAPNWNTTDGVVTIRASDQPPLEVRLTHGRDDRSLCAIALLENEGGAVKVTKLTEYFPSHKELDQQYRWGFRWVAGSK